MPGANILIVEDESIIALDIKSSLLAAGYQVVAIASYSQEALEKAAFYHPDLVLMDINLKGDIDGVETAEAIHSQFHIPVIYLTAHADENTLQRAKLTEAFGYILKPFEDRELATAIEIALSRHQAEMAIYKALQKERELNELKSRFVAVVSHEFRNPLSTILFSTELLERYGNTLSEAKRHSYLQRIQVSVQRMSQLLNDVLTIGEAEAGKLDFNPASLDVIKFCSDLIEEFQISIDKSHKLTFEYLTEPPECQAELLPQLDEKLLHHILNNLLSNAIKYSPQGGSVQLTLIFRPKELLFKIQDEGIGIPLEEQPHLFTSFHRASNAKTIPGTGLGLSIVKQCVELHQGSISVNSGVDEGTTFTVVLPVRYGTSADEKNPGY